MKSLPLVVLFVWWCACFASVFCFLFASLPLRCAMLLQTTTLHQQNSYEAIQCYVISIVTIWTKMNVCTNCYPPWSLLNIAIWINLASVFHASMFLQSFFIFDSINIVIEIEIQQLIEHLDANKDEGWIVSYAWLFSYRFCKSVGVTYWEARKKKNSIHGVQKQGGWKEGIQNKQTKQNQK